LNAEDFVSCDSIEETVESNYETHRPIDVIGRVLRVDPANMLNHVHFVFSGKERTVLSYGHEGSQEQRNAECTQTVDEEPFVIASSLDDDSSVNMKIL
jgi:hypothetical protein